MKRSIAVRLGTLLDNVYLLSKKYKWIDGLKPKTGASIIKATTFNILNQKRVHLLTKVYSFIIIFLQE